MLALNARNRGRFSFQSWLAVHRASILGRKGLSFKKLLLLAWLLIKDKETLKKLWHRPRLTLAISISSCLGSIGWFSAMSLTAVPYVKTLGQVEVFFMMLISSLWLKQRVKVKDMGGLVLIALAAVLVLWG